MQNKKTKKTTKQASPKNSHIQLQKSLINITNESILHGELSSDKPSDKSQDKDEPTINLAFSFDTSVLPNAKKTCNVSAKNINKIIDLSSIGATALIDHTLIVSLGDKIEFQLNPLNTYLKTLKAIADYINNNKKIIKINLIIEEEIAKLLNFELAYYIEQTLFHIINYLYYFDELKSKRKELTLKYINIITTTVKQQSVIQDAVHNAVALLDGLFLIKHLANNPANIATPSYLADTAINLVKLANSKLNNDANNNANNAKNSDNIAVEILNKKELQQLNMNAFLSVAKGSVEEPKFIKLTYNGATKNKTTAATQNAKNSGSANDVKNSKTIIKPIILIGKGITFDSGGISIKPSANMDNMKFDMCGAATVLGIFNTVIQLKLPINLICLIPSCENMPSGTAVKPGDVVTTMSGQTVEIANTDAEGRLILCDALTYAAQFNPELVIDLATLTGACIIALGNIASGLYSNDQVLAQDLTNAATKTLDKVWQMPLFEEYTEMLKGQTADLSNIGSWKGAAGSVTAACFLAKFVNYKWAHLDIAGTADGASIYNSSHYNAATGRPFYMLMEFLRKYSK